MNTEELRSTLYLLNHYYHVQYTGILKDTELCVPSMLVSFVSSKKTLSKDKQEILADYLQSKYGALINNHKEEKAI